MVNPGDLAANTSAANTSSRVKLWLQSLGPGIITAALVFGPSKMTITSKLGSEYGFSLIWIILLTVFFMFLFTSMAARIGIATDQSLLSTIRQKWGKTVAAAVGIGVFLVCTSFQAGNSVGVGIAIAEMTHTPVAWWIIIFNLVGISLLFFRSFYNVLEKIMIFLIIVKLFAFIATLIMVKPKITEVAAGIVPSIPDGSFPLIIAFFASSVSIVGACYQAYLVQERRRINPGVVQKGTDSLTGILILGIMSAMVMVCAGAVLHAKGIKVNSATDMSKALEPMFGQYAAILFLTGLFGAAFSALIGNATVGGTILSDSLGLGSKLSSKTVKLLIALIMTIGAIIAIIFGKLPLELIVLAQSITIFIVPFIGIAMYAIANDEKIMGKHKNSMGIKIAGAIGLLLIIVLAVQSVQTIFSNTRNLFSFKYKEKMTTDIQQLYTDLLQPSDALVADIAALEGDIIILGAGGKMGPALAKLAKQAIDKAGITKKVIAVSRFSEAGLEQELNNEGIETISADLLEDEQLQALPHAKNILYLAGTKFGTTGKESFTWAMNAYLPGRVAEKYKNSRIVVFSTGNVYPLTPVVMGAPRKHSHLSHWENMHNPALVENVFFNTMLQKIIPLF